MEMKRPKHPSSHISSVGYDPETGTMAVEFAKGGVYHYSGVEAEIFNGLHSHVSAGSFFHEHVRGKYTGKRQGE